MESDQANNTNKYEQMNLNHGKDELKEPRTNYKENWISVK